MEYKNLSRDMPKISMLTDKEIAYNIKTEKALIILAENGFNNKLIDFWNEKRRLFLQRAINAENMQSIQAKDII